ncbi:MAG TPA: DUF5663 domain-containing protein [Candidatus Saccharimonadales bacterium]|nr:DUF5663 domain-containing protein [Candidatus Saccharimonadales bacterium]
MNLEELARELGLDKLPTEEQHVYLAQIMETLYKRIGLHYAETLSEEELTKFNKIAEENPEKAFDIFKEVFPDYTDVIREQIAILKDDIQSVLPLQ